MWVVRVKNGIVCRAWRAHLKEWLAVVAAAKSPASLYQGKQLKLAVAGLLADQDSSVQQAVLKCFKVDTTSAHTLFLMAINRYIHQRRAIVLLSQPIELED